MAGLAETCSHIAAILYWLKTVHIYSSTIMEVALPNMSCSNEDIKLAEKKLAISYEPYNVKACSNYTPVHFVLKGS